MNDEYLLVIFLYPQHFWILSPEEPNVGAFNLSIENENSTRYVASFLSTEPIQKTVTKILTSTNLQPTID